jgi:hypothetical protein
MCVVRVVHRVQLENDGVWVVPHHRQEPFCADRKTYTKLSTFEYVIKYACTTNLVTNFKFAEEYVTNNKRIKQFKFIIVP